MSFPVGVRALSDWADVLGFLALASFADFEFNGLTLFEVLEAVASDVGEVDEDIIAAFLRDESEALLCVEELNSACSHNNFSFFLRGNSAPLTTARVRHEYQNREIGRMILKAGSRSDWCL